MFTAIAALATTLVTGVTQFFQGKQKIKEAVIETKARLAASTQEYNAAWELRALEGKGWMDEILFLAILAMYIYSAISPEGAAQVFKNWQIIPEWFQKITMALVASIVGVKKLADYGPPLIKGLRDAFRK